MDNEVKDYLDTTNAEDTQTTALDLPQKDDESISIKYEPKFFDSLPFYCSKYFLLNVVPSSAFTFLAIIGFLFMFTRGISVSKNTIWGMVGAVALFFLFFKPVVEFIMIKIKSKEKCSCEFFGDKEKIIIRTPIKEKVYRYDYLKQIVEISDGMIFKFGQVRYFYLPSRIYENNPDFEKYYKILEKNYLV